MLRAETKNESDLGKEAKKYMNEGKLVPDELIINMLKNRIGKDDCKNGFILDGFPRTIPQAEALENVTKMDVVINLSVPEHVIIGKILARRTCEKCGNIYNIADINREGIKMPPILPKQEGICDKCGGNLIQRKDDNEHTIKERIKTYYKQSAPLLNFYKESGILINIDVVGPPEIMVPKIIEKIKESIK